MFKKPEIELVEFVSVKSIAAGGHIKDVDVPDES